MERLTEKQSAGYDLKALNGEWCNHYCHKQRVETCNECGIYQAIQKLAEYEDLGFTPESIAYMAKFFKEHTSAEAIAINMKIAAKLVEWEKWKELEKQGRLIVLDDEKPSSLVDEDGFPIT